MVVTGSVVGSGSIVMTPLLGAAAGFMLLWWLLLSMWSKPIIQAEIARYVVVTKKTFFDNIDVRSDIHYYRQDTLIALRHKEWKMYIKDPNPWDDGPTQKDMPLLYNIEQDPSEKYDIAKSNQKIVSKLEDLSLNHIESTRRAPSQYEKILPSYQAAYDENNKKK